MIEPTAERYAKYVEITNEIDLKLKTIDDETGFYSSHAPIRNHEDFKLLVKQGDKLIPYLFHLMTQRGCTWPILLLLSQIAPKNPIKSKHRGNFDGMIHDWLGWYLTSSYRENDNIYHGLVD